MADTWTQPPGWDMDNAIPLSLNRTYTETVTYTDRYFRFTGLNPVKDYYFLVTGDLEVDVTLYNDNKVVVKRASNLYRNPEIAFVQIEKMSSGYVMVRSRVWDPPTTFTATLKEGRPTANLNIDQQEMLMCVGQNAQLTFWAATDSTEMANNTNVEVRIHNESIVKKVGAFMLEGLSTGTTEVTIRSKLTGITDKKIIRVEPAPSFEGSGTGDDPYIVRTAQDLHNVRYFLTSSFKQVANISLAQYKNWRIIGTSGNPFRGVYDGQGFTISDLTITDSMNHPHRYHSLFGSVKYAYLERIHIENVNISTKNPESIGESMGALAGHFFNSSMKDCHANNVRIRGYVRLGGLIGLMEGTLGVYVDCCSAENVDLDANLISVGGIAGSGAGRIMNSYATGRLAISYNHGDDLNSSMGGIVGQFYFRYNQPASIINCYAACSMTTLGRRDKLGGIAPSTDSRDVTLTNCYYAAAITNDAIGSGIPLSESEMRRSSSFQNWDFFTIWDIIEGSSYPFIHLREKAFKCKSAPLPLLYGKLRRI